MLFKLSIQNIRKSIKDYAIYFFTLILGVAIFYVFNSIESQTVMLKISSNTSQIIELMTTMLSGVSILVSIILGSLIIYANRFLIKRRNKEFGVYLTLGMSKRKMSLLLFFETLLIGIISLGFGLLLGVFLSQFMSIIVANMFEADMTKFEFVFSKDACIKTLIYFGIMYLIVILFNTFQIGKCKLIDLLYGAKKTEKQKLKNPWICVIIFILSCVALIYAYSTVTIHFNDNMNEDDMIKTIAIGAISTLLLFWSLSGLLLKIFTKMKNVYYHELNSFVLRQFSSKINTMVISMTIICLMLFITICMLSVAFSISNSMNDNIKKFTPVDINLYKKWNLTSDKIDYTDAVIKDSKHDIRSTLESHGFDVDKKLKDIVEVNNYQDSNLDLNKTIGNSIEEVTKNYTFIKAEDKENIMKISDYNKVARLYGETTFELNQNEYIVIANFEMMVDVRNDVLKQNKQISLNGHNLIPKYNECKDGFVEMTSVLENVGIILVPDNCVDDSMLYQNLLLANYNAADDTEKENIEKEITKIMDDTWGVESMTAMNTRNYIKSQSVGLVALVTFLGMYLGIIFLISSSAILALKELSESTDNIERYAVLRKIGTDEKIINKALFRQIGLFFMFPLILAVIHSIVGLKFAMKLLNTFGSSGLQKSIFLTMLIILAIYGTYFLITYWGSRNIIKEKN